MTIGFFFVEKPTKDTEGRACARILVQSAKRRMPTTAIVQFTDERTEPVKGVDAVIRKPTEPMALLRMRHHAGVSGEWVFVDTDVVFQRNVRNVFDVEFDIGITTRNWDHLEAASGFSQRMPFNTGVVFSRCPPFWRDVYRRLRLYPESEQEWMGDQEVIGEIVAENASMRWYQVRHFKGSIYNYPPEIPPKTTEKDRLSAAAIVHYKGPSRKAMMLDRHGKRATACVSA